MGSAVNNRLSKYLSEAKINCGETPHSFRVGFSNTLNMLGCSQEEISHYLGWRDKKDMVENYTRMPSTASSFPITGTSPGAVCLSQIPASHPDNLQCIV